MSEELEECERCEGTGFIQTMDDVAEWEGCPNCGGYGAVEPYENEHLSGIDNFSYKRGRKAEREAIIKMIDDGMGTGELREELKSDEL